MKKTIAYKAFDKDWKCRGFQFEVGKTYEHEGAISLCDSGFHVCIFPFDCWSYYFDINALAVVTMHGKTLTDKDGDSKLCGAKITIEAQITLPDFIKAQIDAVFEFCKKRKNNDKNSAQLASSGDYAKLASSGYSAKLASSGDYAQLASSGYSAKLASSGYSAKLASSGDYAKLASSGDYAKLASSGDSAKLASSGDSAQLASSGDSAQLASSGDSAQLASSGDFAHIAANGKNSIAAGIGRCNTVEAALGSWITLVWYDNEGFIKGVKSAQIDGKRLKANTPYKLGKRGGFVKA